MHRLCHANFVELSADATIHFPRTLVFETYRDRLPELIHHLPNVRAITVQSREDNLNGVQGKTRMLNLWEAEADIPKVAQSVMRPDMLAWLDHAVWDQQRWECVWCIETKMFRDQVRCSGTTQYLDVSGGTLLRIRGDLDLTLTGIPGVPKLLAGVVRPAVEKFIVSLLTPNLLSVASGLEAFLASEKK